MLTQKKTLGSWREGLDAADPNRMQLFMVAVALASAQSVSSVQNPPFLMPEASQAGERHDTVSPRQ
jgi:hypothetical protein